MPTTLYTNQKITSVGYDGKEYEIKNGAVDVPDNAVAVLTESFGFFTTAPEQAEIAENDVFDIKKLTKSELVKLNKEAELGASVANTMSLEKVQELVFPLWEAKQAEIAANAKAEEEKAA